MNKEFKEAAKKFLLLKAGDSIFLQVIVEHGIARISFLLESDQDFSSYFIDTQENYLKNLFKL